VAPGVGELDAAATRAQHRLAHRVGELAQQPRDGGLRERELVGGARDAAQAHAGLEGDQLGKHAVAEIAAKSRSGHVPSPKVR
jgi:hypothetical protein